MEAAPAALTRPPEPSAAGCCRRGQQEKNHHRPGHKGEKERHRQGDGGAVRHLRGEGQQAQQKEKKHLHEACGPVKEVHQGLLVGQAAVAQENAGEVDAEVAVAPPPGWGAA